MAADSSSDGGLRSVVDKSPRSGQGRIAALSSQVATTVLLDGTITFTHNLKGTIMKTRFLLFWGTLIAAVPLVLMLGGCGGEQKLPPVPVGETEEYRDPVIGFHIQVPKGWIRNVEVGRARFYNAIEVDKKFLDPTGVAPLGVEVAIDVTKTPEPMERIKEIKGELKSMNFQLGAEEPVTIGEMNGTKITFTGNYGNKNIVRGYHIWLSGDSVAYDLSFSGFGGHDEAYAAVFDAMLKSFEPGKPKDKEADVSLPSESFTPGETKYFTYVYPENFNFTNPPKGSFEFSQELRGYRQDCSVRFDVFGAKGLSVEKAFEQNKGKYRAKSTGKATIGGLPALYVAYSPAAQVESRAYFMVKDDKVYRVTTNWYKPQEEAYMAAYQKMLGSVKFK